MLIVVLLAGCLPPSVLGVHTDGLLPAAGEVEAALGVGAGTLEGESLFDDDWSLQGGGITGSVGVAEGVAVGGTFALVSKEVQVDVEGRWQLVHEDESMLNFTILGGWGVWAFEDAALHGPHIGAVGSIPVGADLRPTMGLVLNLQVGNDLDSYPLHVQVPVGLSWRPEISEAFAGLLMVQVLPMWTRIDGEGGYMGWGAGLALGGKFGGF